MEIKNVDIVCGLTWGDEGKGKVVSNLLSTGEYDWVCRWSGGSNAGHTIYINNQKYVTHIVPSGIFYNKKCFIGPDCFLNVDDFIEETEYLKKSGFDISLIKISPKIHIVLDKHKKEDMLRNQKKHLSTCKGIAPCASDKFNRTGTQLEELFEPRLNSFILKNDEHLYGDLLCEGAQGFWLDINYGSYPFVTSSYTLPYSACSLGFPPSRIRKIYGACKIYDTRIGVDFDFDQSIKKFSSKIGNDHLEKICLEGKEYGSTTGKKRRVNWLNLDKLIEAINISGTSHIVISKVDIFEKLCLFKFIYKDKLVEFESIETLKSKLVDILNTTCKDVQDIIFSNNPHSI